MRIFTKTAMLVAAALIFVTNVMAQQISGVVVDKSTKEPLIGVTVIVKGTTMGAATDIDGRYILNGMTSGCELSISYLSYKTIETGAIDFGQAKDLVINFELASDDLAVETVTVVGRANRENENILQTERINSSFAIENIGAKELSRKGLSNVEDGVKKMTGISIADQGELFVRGLGDRYSLTTLNGLPIASPNPDKKLIPLDLFPSSTVKNITVSKVYQVGAFADYSGALIDITTKDNIGTDFFNISASIGGAVNTVGRDFLHSDRSMLFPATKLPAELDNINGFNEFDKYISKNNPFKTSFSIDENIALPDFSAQVGYGKSWIKDNGNSWNLLVSLSANNSRESVDDGLTRVIDSKGKTLSSFNYDSYTTNLNLAGLFSLGYSFGEGDRISYTAFYSRNVEDNFKDREGVDEEGISLRGLNSVMHIYSLLNNQITGTHNLSDSWKLDWSGSYSMTTSGEPDRRQVMLQPEVGGVYVPFLLNSQETMRYFGDLDENEMIGDMKLKYNFGEKNLVRFGAAYRNKQRSFEAKRFYYGYREDDSSTPENDAYLPEIDNVYELDDILGYDNLNDGPNGNIDLDMDNPLNATYEAQSSIAAGFAEVDYNIGSLLINAGVRVEYANQTVDYYDTFSVAKQSQIKKTDIFPALNFKYGLADRSSIRLALSKTITRPSFVEMAPFPYKESYGTSEMIGNENIQNGYNYNVDLRYDIFSKESTDMLSFTAYYKYLDSPIERVQKDAGGTTQYTFRNIDKGMATGIEIEARKSIIENLRVGFNASYIFTSVNLESDEKNYYTDNERQLQGASPYLINADITYAFKPADESQMSFALLYNLQGPCIDAVGVLEMENVIQQEIHTLDFVYNYQINSKWAMSVKGTNLLNSRTHLTQEVGDKNITVGKFRTGQGVQVGFSLKL